MKIKIVFTSAILAAVMFSCNSDKKTDSVAVDSLGVETSYTVDTAASSIFWEGNMIGVYKHSGTLALSQGSVTVKGLQVTGGSFTANLKTINPTDSNYTEKTPRVGLIGHLSAADFFAVDSFPTATFVIKSVSGNSATGDLTVRGKTNEETVTDIAVDTTGGIKATGKLVFDRQKYNVAYKAAGDKVLSNDITLDITLVGKK